MCIDKFQFILSPQTKWYKRCKWCNILSNNLELGQVCWQPRLLQQCFICLAMTSLNLVTFWPLDWGWGGGDHSHDWSMYRGHGGVWWGLFLTGQWQRVLCGDPNCCLYLSVLTYYWAGLAIYSLQKNMVKEHACLLCRDKIIGSAQKTSKMTSDAMGSLVRNQIYRY